MAEKKKTPAQVRDAKLKKLADAVKAKQITAQEYRKGVTAARETYANAIKAASAMSRAETLLAGASRLKGPGQALMNIAKGGITPGQRLATAATTIAGPWAVGKIREAGAAQSKRTVRVPSSNVDKAAAAAGQRVRGVKAAAPKPTAARRSADSGDSARTPKPLTKTQQRGSMGLTGTSYTVKKGDSLWAIAKANKTSVDALLKANPEIAKRKAAGKTTIYSGSKVRIPGKK